jgi:hypothetical protein
MESDHGLNLSLSMMFSEIRLPLFGIMLWAQGLAAWRANATLSLHDLPDNQE